MGLSKSEATTEALEQGFDDILHEVARLRASIHEPEQVVAETKSNRR